MRIANLKNLAESEDSVMEVLEELQEDFQIVDDIAVKMKKDISDNPETIRTCLSKLGGAYSNLITALGVVGSAKTNTQLKYYEKQRKELAVSRPTAKFNVSATKEEARAQVLNYRRARNIIEGYKDSAGVNITVLQSLKKDDKKNRQTPGE